MKTMQDIEPEKLRNNLQNSLARFETAQSEDEGWIKELNNLKAAILARLSSRSGDGYYRSEERLRALNKIIEAAQWLGSDIEGLKQCQEVDRKYLSDLS